MVKPIAKAEISSFVKGLITEASPLNFPADASRDEENFVLNNNGSRDRRLGLDFETNHTIRSTSYTEEDILEIASTSYKWFGAGKSAANEFAVVQFGSKVDIYDVSKDSISTDGFVGSVTLTNVLPSTKFSYASVDGLLIIAAKTDTMHIIQYVAPNLTYETKSLLVRDLWGLEGSQNNDLNLRPAVATDAIAYNLRNQGWGIPRKNSAGTLVDPLAEFYTTYSKYPANSEVVHTGLQFQPVTSGTSFERMYTNLYDDMLGLESSVAAKGYFIIDALKRGTSRTTAYANNKTKFPSLGLPLTTLPADTTNGGCSLVTDFAGRVFYSGFQGDTVGSDKNSPILSGYVLFSQIIKGQEDTIKCYQSGDPTSRENSDLVDTDGGFIRISGAKQVFGLVGLSANLFVIADNGVWMISGGSDYGFSATNYLSKKITNFGCNNQNSIVTVNNQIFFWGEEGIFVIAQNQYGDWNVTSLSEKSIQSLYDSIGSTDRENARGIYDIFDKKIRWLYNQDTDIKNRNIVRELVLDLKLSAFSLSKFYNLSLNSPEIVGFIPTSSFISGEIDNDVYTGVIPVVVNGDQVVVNKETRTSGLQSIKYIALHSAVGNKVGYSFAQYRNLDFTDWHSVDGVGVDAAAYILTGTITAGDSSISKQTPYLTLHMLRTENGVEESGEGLIPRDTSSCLISSHWDWAISANSNKFSKTQEGYRYRRPKFIVDDDDDFDNGFEVVTSKSKLRGRGRAISLLFSTSPQKDCRILGWNLSLTGNNL